MAKSASAVARVRPHDARLRTHLFLASHCGRRFVSVRERAEPAVAQERLVRFEGRVQWNAGQLMAVHPVSGHATRGNVDVTLRVDGTTTGGASASAIARFSSSASDSTLGGCDGTESAVIAASEAPDASHPAT